MEHGTLLNKADFVGIQEHGLHGESIAVAERRLRRHAWDPLIADAYFKLAAYGGGTALLAKSWSGIRPLALATGCGETLLKLLEGRYSQGMC